MPKVKNTPETIELNEVRSMVRTEIDKRYGSVAAFLRSKDSEKFGGKKIRCYLYDAGAKNFEVIAGLCKYFGIGTLTRETKVTRVSTYSLEKCNSEETK